MEKTDATFVIPEALQPSALRRFARRTLFLRLLDGRFVLWCFETNRTSQKTAACLSHARVAVSDPAALEDALRDAMQEVGVNRLFHPKTILILDCHRGFNDPLTPLEKQALSRLGHRLGAAELFFAPPELADADVATFCHEVGALRRRFTERRANQASG